MTGKRIWHSKYQLTWCHSTHVLISIILWGFNTVSLTYGWFEGFSNIILSIGNFCLNGWSWRVTTTCRTSMITYPSLPVPFTLFTFLPVPSRFLTLILKVIYRHLVFYPHEIGIFFIKTLLLFWHKRLLWHLKLSTIKTVSQPSLFITIFLCSWLQMDIRFRKIMSRMGNQDLGLRWEN